MQWAFPSLNLDMSIIANTDVDQNRMATSVDPDETAHNEPSHQDLYCSHKYLVWSAGLKWLRLWNVKSSLV